MIYRYLHVVLSCSPAVARPPPLLLVVHQQYTAVHFCWYISSSTTPGSDSCIKKQIFCTPTTFPPTSTTETLLLYLLCAHTSLARRRSPAAAFVGYTGLYTAFAAAVPGNINTVPYLVAVCIINNTSCSPLYQVCMIYRYRYVLLSCSPAVARPPPLLLVVHRSSTSLLVQLFRVAVLFGVTRKQKK